MLNVRWLSVPTQLVMYGVVTMRKYEILTDDVDHEGSEDHHPTPTSIWRRRWADGIISRRVRRLRTVPVLCTLHSPVGHLHLTIVSSPLALYGNYLRQLDMTLRLRYIKFKPIFPDVLSLRYDCAAIAMQQHFINYYKYLVQFNRFIKIFI